MRYVNDRYHRTGILWEGRYKACLVDTEFYLLRCYGYIELNPLRARMVAAPADYPWSSFASNALAVVNPLMRPHSSYLSLGADTVERCAAYRALIEQVIAPDELDIIRLHLQRQHAYGPERFRAAIETQLFTPRRACQIGRPGKSGPSMESPT